MLAALQQDEPDVRCLLADLAALRGYPRLARALMELEGGELELRCECGAFLPALGPGARGLEIAPLRWTECEDAGDAAAAGCQELAALAGGLGHAPIAAMVSDLGRCVGCPRCARPVAILASAITP